MNTHLPHNLNIFTHALAPVVILKMTAGHPRWLGKYGFLAIGLAGAMPDLLNPHLTLEARLASWSHGLPFWGSMTAVLLLASLFKQSRISPKLAVVLSLAYFLHLFCDAISGGVDWLYPVNHFVWGGYFFDPIYWVPLDVFFFLLTYYLFRIAPSLRKATKLKE